MKQMLFALFAILGVVLAGCNSEQQPQTPTPQAPAQAPQEAPKAAAVELAANCDDFPDNLETCSPYKCQFKHPFTGEQLVKEIVGDQGGKCVYKEQMPNGGQMDCAYTPELRVPVSQYYRAVAAAESSGTSITMDGEGTKTTYTINGQQVENPLEEAMNNGQCAISGY